MEQGSIYGFTSALTNCVVCVYCVYPYSPGLYNDIVVHYNYYSQWSLSRICTSACIIAHEFSVVPFIYTSIFF